MGDMSEIPSSPLTPPPTTDQARTNAVTRAAAHTPPAWLVLRPAQRWEPGVTDLAVARALLALECHGVRPYLSQSGRWLAPCPLGPLAGMQTQLSTVIKEMIRTGLVRHWRTREGDHLVPAPVHLGIASGGDWRSACLFVGEDMGPMRARLVDRLDLVDCLDCERTVATGAVRGL